MARSQYDVARSFYPLFAGFGPLELEPRRVGGPTRHGALPMRRGALVLLPFWVFWCLWGGATSCWRPNTTWRAPNATWRTRFALFLGDLDPWISSHVVLEPQRDMAGAQYDVARSSCSLLGCFGPFGLEPRRVGGSTRHGRLPMRRGQALMRRGRAQYNVTRLCLGTSTKKATSELSQRWQVQFLFGFLFA